MNDTETPCPICNNSNAGLMEDQTREKLYNCPRCGEYYLAFRAGSQTLNVPMHIVSGITRYHWDVYKQPFHVTVMACESMDELRKLVPFPIPGATDVRSKADLFMQAIRRKTRYLGEVMEIDSRVDCAIGFCENAHECDFCLDFLLNQDLVVKIEAPGFGCPPGYRITPAGWAYLSGIGADVLPQGFIAMAFSPKEVADELNMAGLQKGISAAGYAPRRIDSKEHNNRIDDEIVAEIRKSRFVVADLTDKNAGAYFEAGFAMGLGKPVIWTCRQTDIDAPGGVHFDTRQYSIVPWTEKQWDDFSRRLTLRIEATIGHGPLKDNRA